MMIIKAELVLFDGRVVSRLCFGACLVAIGEHPEGLNAVGVNEPAYELIVAMCHLDWTVIAKPSQSPSPSE